MRAKYTLSLNTMAPVESELTEYLESLEKGGHRSREVRRLILYGFVTLINNKSSQEASFDSLDNSSKKVLMDMLSKNNSPQKVIDYEDYEMKESIKRLIKENEALKKESSSINSETSSKEIVQKEKLDLAENARILKIEEEHKKEKEKLISERLMLEEKLKMASNNHNNSSEKQAVNKNETANDVKSEALYFEDPEIDIEIDENFDLDDEIIDPLSMF